MKCFFFTKWFQTWKEFRCVYQANDVMQKIEKTKNNFQTNNGFQNTFPQKIPYRISTQHPDPVNCASSKGCLTCVPMNSVEIS